MKNTHWNNHQLFHFYVFIFLHVIVFIYLFVYIFYCLLNGCKSQLFYLSIHVDVLCICFMEYSSHFNFIAGHGVDLHTWARVEVDATDTKKTWLSNAHIGGGRYTQNFVFWIWKWYVRSYEAQTRLSWEIRTPEHGFFYVSVLNPHC